MPKRKNKTAESQRRAVDAYKERRPMKGIGATLPAAEAEAITAILKAHKIGPADALRATAQSLTDGSTTADQIRTAAQTWTEARKAEAQAEAEAQPGTEAADAPGSTTTDSPPTPGKCKGAI